MARGLTSITVRELDIKLTWFQRLVAQKFKSEGEAIKVAHDVLEQWKLTQNEWREQSKDRDSTFATKNDLDGLKEIVRKLEQKNSNTDGRWWTAGFMFAAVIALAALYLKKG